MLFKCNNSIPLSFLLRRTVYDVKAPFYYTVNQQVHAHLMQLGRGCVVFFPYGKNNAHNAAFLNAPYTLKLMADADFGEMELTRENLAYLHSIADGLWK